MPSLSQVARAILVAPCLIGGLAFAQGPPALSISPAKATMLVGDTRTFRAVGRDGRMRHPVRWSISPESAATLTMDGDEATLQAKDPASSLVLTGYAGSDSAEASIEIRSGPLTPGTQIWSVTSMPGCKTGQIIQAVPTADGPDLYVQEDCPGGTVLRALTADGREMWRTGMPGSVAHGAAGPAAKEQGQLGGRLNLRGSSICDEISAGVTKEVVSKVVDDRKLRLAEDQRQSNNWVLEEDGFRCTILFDSKTGAVLKKKKVIVTD